MTSDNMGYEDYLNLYCFIQTQNELRFKYADFIPREEDIEKYNNAVEKFKIAWERNRGQVEKPIIFKNVQRDNYYIDRLNKAHKFEVFVENEFKKYGIDIGFYKDKESQYKGETEIGLEIKNDMKLKDTGNVFIEVKQRLNNDMDWLDSGIFKQDNTKWQLIGDENEYYIIYKDDLIKEYELVVKYKTYKIKIEKKNGGTGQGFLLSRERAKEIMIADNIADFISKVF